MEFIRGYKSVEYYELQKELNDRFVKSGKTFPELAVSAELQSTAGVKNAFDFEEQKVSDKVLTSILRSIGINGFVLWINGERKYFLSNKN